MLYYLFEFLNDHYDIPGAGVFKYITFRAGIAIILSLLISMIIGRRVIDYLRKLQIGESVRDLGLQGQKEKQGTPTMGGVIIVAAIVIPCLLLTKLDNIYIQLMLLSTLWMATIGFIDDYIKVFKKDKQGLKGRFKILGQVVLGLIVGVAMLSSEKVVVRLTPEDAQLNGYEVIREVRARDPKNPNKTKDMVYCKALLTNVPFIKDNEIDYSRMLWFLGDNGSQLAGILFIILVVFIVTAVSNAANLTDGIDGLAAGVSAIIGAALGVLTYVSSNSRISDYLNILYIPYTSELVIFCACFIGACIGFLWYNAYPAKVFMGDTGSLTLGGIIAALAIIIRKELLIPVLCGIFFAEALSVSLQVAYFKYTKKKYGEGRRIFLMSPLHHHYQKQGYHEAKIVTRFWIIQILLTVLAIITLKLR